MGYVIIQSTVYFFTGIKRTNKNKFIIMSFTTFSDFIRHNNITNILQDEHIHNKDWSESKT